MTKFTKKLCLTLCIFAGLLLSTLGISTIKMPTVQASSATSFNMIDAASLRVSGENNGLRFCAEIGTELYSTVTATDGAYFGMIIIPDEYRTTTYKAQIEESYDYVTALKNAGATLLNIENIIPYEYDSDKDEVVDAYRMNGVISNVRYYNLNYDFVGIAYYYVPGDGYHYVDNHQTATAQNVYDVAMRLLYKSETYDAVTGMPETALGYLDEYKFLAEQQAIGAEQPDDTAIATYKANMTANREAFDGETIDLGSDASFSLVSDGLYNSGTSRDYVVETEDTFDYFRFRSYGYGSIKISFPAPITVYADSELEIKLKGTSADKNGDVLWSNWLRISKYGSSETGYSIKEFGYTATNSDWQTISVPLDKVGYTAGEVIKGLTILFYGGQTPDCCIDYIKVTSPTLIKEKLANKLTGEQVANFDDADYSKFVTIRGTSYEIKNGTISITSPSWTWNRFNFITPKTVTDGDFIILRMQANDRVRMGQNGATNAFDIFHSNFINTYPAVGYSNEMQTVYVPVYMLGYTAGQTISYVDIAWWRNDGAEGTFVIDYIEYHSANLAANVVADYTDETLGVALSSRQPYYYYTLSGSNPYAYPKAGTGSYDSEKGATVVSTNSNYVAFRLMLQKPITVTENTKISIVMSYLPTGTEWGYLRGIKLDNGCYNSLNLKSPESLERIMLFDGQFYTVVVNATRIANVGETITYLEFALCAGSMAFKTISITQ